MAWAPQLLLSLLHTKQIDVETTLPGSHMPLLRTRISAAGDVLVFVRCDSLGALHPQVIAAHRQAVNDAVTDLRDTVARLGWALAGVFGILAALFGCGGWARGLDIPEALGVGVIPLLSALVPVARSWLKAMLLRLLQGRLSRP